ncbi:MAG: DUF2156 domain-containing protein [Deltaproteobacteria bacterium]|nr:DUF2156 domain-containing protein [Deltaproteobacteria bacterium]
MIPDYPDLSEVSIGHRQVLHPLFKRLECGVSEFTFANIFLFRKTHGYMLSRLPDGTVMISGRDNGKDFFMLPFGLPKRDLLDGLFKRFSCMKNASERQTLLLREAGYGVKEDRDNFDYLYSREEMAGLSGRKFHRKKNLVNLFTGSYRYEVRPLLDEYIPDALGVLEGWRDESSADDYDAAKEALGLCGKLQLCGSVYYVEGTPAAYILGEELKKDTFVVHFEKAAGEFKGLLQFVNQSFSAGLPERYVFINREQDLGQEGLRKSKMSYRPVGFVKKYKVSV